MKAHKSQNHKASDEQGLVSIVVTVVMMLVISLIVIAFARIIRREQRQTLDRQLSTQAFYTAESGVNAASNHLLGNPTYEKPDCPIPPTGTAPPIEDVMTADAAGNQVTCLIIDTSPESLEFTNIDEESRVIPLQPKNPSQNIRRVELVWSDKASRAANLSSCPATPSLPTAGAWSRNTGILRADLVNTQGSLNRNTMLTNTFTTFLYPCTSGSTSQTFSSAAGPGNQGTIIRTQCTNASTNPSVCTMMIAGLNSKSYHLRIRSVYVPSNVTVRAYATVSGGTPIELVGAQAVIDSTAVATDVLRRIQVRVPLNGPQNLPDYVIESADDICKRYSVIPGQGFLDSGGCPIN